MNSIELLSALKALEFTTNKKGGNRYTGDTSFCYDSWSFCNLNAFSMQGFGDYPKVAGVEKFSP